MHFKRKLVIATTALAVAAFAGGAYAASQDSAANQRQAFLNDVAKRLNVSPQQLTAAIEGAYVDQLNAAVKAGRLTQAQADALTRRAKNGAIPFRLGGPGFGLGRALGGTLPGAPPDKIPAPPFEIPGGGPRSPLGAAASYLGLSESQLGAQLESGTTLAQIAAARQKSVSGLEQAMIAPIKSRLDQAVSDKELTSAQEQQALSRLSTRIGDEINGRAPAGGPRFWWHRAGAGGAGGAGAWGPAGPPPGPHA